MTATRSDSAKYLIKIVGDEQDRRAGFPRRDQLRMHIGDRPDIEPAHRLAGENETRVRRQHAPEYQFLHIAARHGPDVGLGRWAFDVVIGDDLFGKARHCRPVEKARAAEGLVAIALGDGILHRRHAGDEAGLVAILRDPPDAELRHVMRRQRANVIAEQAHCAVCRRQQSAEEIGQLALAVSGNAGKPDDLAAMDRERHMIETLRDDIGQFDLHRAFRLLLGLGLGHWPAHHQFRQLLPIGCGLLTLGDDAARRARRRCGRSPSSLR